MPRPADFAKAVRAACEAYAKTGRLIDAALIYAKHGVPIFPVDHTNKRPIPKRDPDPSGKYPRGLPRTGGFYKATCDPIVIKHWWKQNPRALIAMPMGPRSGIWCVDVDTGEEHVDGVAEWQALLAQHDPFETREHRSATGGPHVLFAWEEALPIGCSKGQLKDLSLSIKGEGGYILVPPSVRKQRPYTVFRDCDPIIAPSWLTGLILPDPQAARTRRTKRTSTAPPIDWKKAPPPDDVDLDEIAEAMEFIPNDDLPREEWMAWGLCLFHVSGGCRRGFEIFDKWSRKSSKYHGGTYQRWFEMTGSPPNRTGIGKIYAAARANGWAPKLKAAPPTYAIAADPVAEARDKMRQVVRDFLRAVDNPVSWRSISNVPPPPIAHAACIDVGVGKTRITIEELAIWLKQKQRSGPVVYAVPRHKLGEDILRQFTGHGINARIFRGREAEDPQRDLLQPNKKMCLNLAAVELAKKCLADIGQACCKYKKMRCRFFGQCGYQRQLRDRDGVQVWIVAIDTLFHTQKALGEPVIVIVDEALWQKGIRGVEANEDFDWTVAIDSISNQPPPPRTLNNINTYSKLRAIDFLHLRHGLASALRAQPVNGAVEHKYLDAQNLDGSSCKRALGLEWERYTADIKKLGQQPGMPDTQIAALAANQGLIDRIQHARRVIQIWEAAQEFLNRADIDVSGRLTLAQDNGQRTVEWRGIKPISSQFTLPTLMLDATLPPERMLQVYHPRAQVVADIKVELPKSVHIRQLQGAPTSSRKLERDRYLGEVRRHILARYLAFNRPLTLVICQQKVEEWFKPRLPNDITVEHYNNITGIDHYGDVRLLLLVGRTAPGPATTETITAALTGKSPLVAPVNGNGFRWFDQVPRGIRLRDGSGIATKGDQHPDAVVEAVRYQIHEGELVQALGRGRALNRTAVNPLDADLLFDTAIPVTVDEVIPWKVPSPLIETAIDGVMLTAPCDLVEIWKYLWPNDKAAYRTIRAGVPKLSGFERVEYQLAGPPKTHQRVGYFDLGIIPDPRAWLEARLGRLI